MRGVSEDSLNDTCFIVLLVTHYFTPGEHVSLLSKPKTKIVQITILNFSTAIKSVCLVCMITNMSNDYFITHITHTY